MKTRKKLWFLNIGVAAAIIFSLIYVISVGRSYTLHTNVFLNNVASPEAAVTFAEEGIVKLTDTRIDNGELVIDLESVAAGKTDVHVTYKLDGELYQLADHTLRVTVFNTLIDTAQGYLSFTGFAVVIRIFAAVLFLIQFVMMWMFSDYRKKGDFSYPMVVCGGIGIYDLALFLYMTYKLLNNAFNDISYVFLVALETGGVLLVGLLPVMAVFSLMLAVSNIWLIRHEGRRLVNMLGIAFAVAWIIGTALTLFANDFGSLVYVPVFSIVRLILIYIIAFFECMFLSVAACTFLATKYTPALDRDYIIILGCAIFSDGSLTPLLKSRVDAAVAFEKKQYEQTGKHAVFVPSGGQGSDEIISEGQAMENYLLSIGIPAGQIAREDRSVNTFQNMQFSKEVIERVGGDIKDKKIAFATTNYHVFRGYILAGKNGLEAKGISARTKPYFYLNAFLREFVGLIADQKLSLSISILTIIAVLLLFNI